MDGISVAEAADLIGVSSDTIRRWAKKGLVKAWRNEQGHRVFEIEELRRLHNKLSGQGGEHPEYEILTTQTKSSLSVIELFAGAGGLALGLSNAGLSTKMLIEFNADAAATLKVNRPDWNVIHDDVANIDYAGVTADIVAGGFPCQAFSYAGNKLGFADTRGTLFFEFARAIQEVRPKIAIGENVRGLHKHDGGRTLQTMVGILHELGYRVAYRVLRSQYLDVPQKRERLVILAVRNDLSIPALYPGERDYTISLREALKDVPASDGASYPDRKKAIMSVVPPGGYWRDLPEDLQREYMAGSYYLPGGKTGMARRLSWDEPSLTLTTSPAQKQTERCHPSETRPLSVREYARIQSFPDTWEFVGSTASKYRQIGNAVPVNMGYHIGQAVRRMLETDGVSLSGFETEPFVQESPTIPLFPEGI